MEVKSEVGTSFVQSEDEYSEYATQQRKKKKSKVRKELLKDSPSEDSSAPSQHESGQGSASVSGQASDEASWHLVAAADATKTLISPDGLWFSSSELARCLSMDIKSFYRGQSTCFSRLPREEQDLWWRCFERKYTWDPQVTPLVKKEWKTKVGKILSNLAYKVGKRPASKQVSWMTGEAREALQNLRSDPLFQQKSIQCTRNRIDTLNAGSSHTQGSLSTADVARRMVKEGKNPTPSEFVRTHSREDPVSGRVFVDDKSRSFWENYEALRVERNIEEGTPEAQQLYYEVAGGWKHRKSIYGLGNSATLFYEKPTPSIVSTGSSQGVSVYSLQQQLTDERQKREDERRQLEEQLEKMREEQRRQLEEQREEQCRQLEEQRRQSEEQREEQRRQLEERIRQLQEVMRLIQSFLSRPLPGQ